MKTNSRGFTVIETIICVAVVGTLSLMTYSYLKKGIENIDTTYINYYDNLNLETGEIENNITLNADEILNKYIDLNSCVVQDEETFCKIK